MVALWVRAGTALVGDTDLGIRLLAPLAAALGSILLADAGRLLWDRRTGILAALLLNATLLFGIGSVTMTPDTPELLFWTATLWALVRVRRNANWWYAAGLFAGLGLDSKYTAALLFPATLAWLLTPAMRPWLRRPQPWLALGLAALLFLPVILWNAGHDWASFAKQGGRADAWQPARAVQFEAELLLGQIGLATPFIAVLCAAGLVAALRRWRDPDWALLAALAAVPAALFLEHAIGDRVQANWPAILYPSAALAAARLAPHSRWRPLIRSGIGLGLLVTVLVWLQAATGLLPLPMRADPTLLRIGGWDGVAAAIAEHPAAYVAAENYGQAALLARLLPGTTVLGIEPRWALFDLPDGRADVAGKPGLLLRSLRRAGGPDPKDWSGVQQVATIGRGRNGMTAEAFRLYSVVGAADGTPIAVMPTRR